MKIVVIGANGQLGCDIARTLEKEHVVVPLTHEDIEISSIGSCENLKQHEPDVIINTAAFHNVPVCEEKPVESFQINTIGAYNLARICSELDAVLVHTSTDYVFDGEKTEPYVETDLPRPLNMYGITKLAGENAIRYTCPKHFIIRVCGLYGEHKCRAKERNFPELMVYLYKQGKDIRVVNDEFLTPTFTGDLACQISELMKTDKYGLYHMTSNGSCSWYEFAVKIFELLDVDVKVTPVAASVFPSTVLRPGYSVLENHNLKEIGLDIMRPWQEALADYLSRADILNKV